VDLPPIFSCLAYVFVPDKGRLRGSHGLKVRRRKRERKSRARERDWMERLWIHSLCSVPARYHAHAQRTRATHTRNAHVRPSTGRKLISGLDLRSSDFEEEEEAKGFDRKPNEPRSWGYFRSILIFQLLRLGIRLFCDWPTR
jgi:hypothetical protein